MKGIDGDMLIVATREAFRQAQCPTRAAAMIAGFYGLYSDRHSRRLCRALGL